MADLTNITIPAAYNDVIAKIRDTGYFSDQITICKFAFAYAIKNHFGEFNPSDIDKQNSGGDGGLNYNVGSFDGEDKFLFNFVSSAYPDCDSPYKWLRGIVIYGLMKLKEKLKNINSVSYEDIISV